MLATVWHKSWQKWLPHGNWRLQRRSHGFDSEFQQGCSEIIWPPTHGTEIFISHGGCGSFLNSNCSGGRKWKIKQELEGEFSLKAYEFLQMKTSTFFVCSIEGISPMVNSLLNFTAAWHLALQIWPQFVVSFGRLQGWLHGGHSCLWHRCLL